MKKQAPQMREKKTKKNTKLELTCLINATSAMPIIANMMETVNFPGDLLEKQT